jgi:hypothetical protein
MAKLSSLFLASCGKRHVEDAPKKMTISPIKNALITDVCSSDVHLMFKEAGHPFVPGVYPESITGFRPFGRIFVLLPTRLDGGNTSIWVPYLVDPGSPSNFICKKYFELLGHHCIEKECQESATIGRLADTNVNCTEDERVRDLNLLGFDFLRMVEKLTICYKKKILSFSATSEFNAESVKKAWEEYIKEATKLHSPNKN